MFKEKPMTTSTTSETSDGSQNQNDENGGGKEHEDETEKSSGAENDDGQEEAAGFVTFASKFTFVDLAGSERAYRTQSTGNTFSEGVAINTGLVGDVLPRTMDTKIREFYIEL